MKLAVRTEPADTGIFVCGAKGDRLRSTGKAGSRQGSVGIYGTYRISISGGAR